MGVYKTHIEPFLLAGERWLNQFDFNPAAGVTLATGGKVAALIEQGRLVTGAQSTDSKRPLLVENALNGHPVVRFSGGQVLNFGADCYAFNSDLDGRSRTVYYVVNKPSANLSTWLSKSMATSGPDRQAFFLNGQGQLNSYFFSRYTQDHSALAPWAGSGWAVLTQQIVMDTPTQGRNRILINGSQAVEVGSVGTMRPSAHRLLVGAYNGSNDAGEQSFLQGDIARIIGYDGRPHTDQEIQAKVTELRTLYGI